MRAQKEFSKNTDMGSKILTPVKRLSKKDEGKEFDYSGSQNHTLYSQSPQLLTTSSRALLWYRCGSSDSSHEFRQTDCISSHPCKDYYLQCKQFRRFLPQQYAGGKRRKNPTPLRVLSGKPWKLKQALKIEYWKPLGSRSVPVVLSRSLVSLGFQIRHIWRRRVEKLILHADEEFRRKQEQGQPTVGYWSTLVCFLVLVLTQWRSLEPCHSKTWHWEKIAHLLLGHLEQLQRT